MVEVHPEDAQDLIFEDAQVSEMKQKGGAKSARLYEATKGRVLEYKNGQQQLYYYLDEIEAEAVNLKDMITNMVSHYEIDEQEVELYRWGIEKPVEANQDTFGVYRILVTNKATGFIDWYREAGKTIKFNSLQKAKNALREIQITSPICKPMIV